MEIVRLSLMQKGGPMMWPLLIMSFIGVLLAVERMLYLHRGQIRAGEFISGIKNLLRKRRLVEALTLCEETLGPIPKVVKAALLNYDQPEGKIRDAVQSAAFVEVPNLERRTASIGIIAKIAPLMGLLGTIIALVQAFFEVQREGGYTEPVVLTQFVAQAMISTAVGIGIAILAYLVYHLILGRVRALVHDMEWVAHDIMQFLLRDLPEDVEPNLGEEKSL